MLGFLYFLIYKIFYFDKKINFFKKIKIFKVIFWIWLIEIWHKTIKIYSLSIILNFKPEISLKINFYFSNNYLLILKIKTIKTEILGWYNFNRLKMKLIFQKILS